MEKIKTLATKGKRAKLSAQKEKGKRPGMPFEVYFHLTFTASTHMTRSDFPVTGGACLKANSLPQTTDAVHPVWP